mmetsp:Transcript_39570/g.82192  ORF Transcript_39570/g.82192 Transcript_39570/m.82192 type:complete len:109 (+) Transcript_39570:1090-1416(+)
MPEDDDDEEDVPGGCCPPKPDTVGIHTEQFVIKSTNVHILLVLFWDCDCGSLACRFLGKQSLGLDLVVDLEFVNETVCCVGHGSITVSLCQCKCSGDGVGRSPLPDGL